INGYVYFTLINEPSDDDDDDDDTDDEDEEPDSQNSTYIYNNSNASFNQMPLTMAKGQNLQKDKIYENQ
ncbi:hypothetical protein Tco_0325598, partial [Tanacetum coccineum]